MMSNDRHVTSSDEKSKVVCSRLDEGRIGSRMVEAEI